MALSFHTSLAKGSKRKVKILGLNSYFRRSYRGETGRGRFAPPFFSYFIQSQVLYPQLTLQQLIQLDLESGFIVRFQLGPSIQSGSSPSARLQVVTQSTHLSKDCYAQLVLNPHRSEIRPPKQLDYRCMPLHLACHYNLIRVNSVTDSCWGLVLFLLEPIPNPSFWVPSSYKLNLEISC